MGGRLRPADLRRLHRKAGAATWGLSPEQFGTVLEASLAHGCPDSDPPAIERYLATLHLSDLALAAACAEGHEGAWEQFIRDFRPILYRAADAIDPTGAAREAADSLYGELFGLTERDGARRSHFHYFHGRSSLATWLRAILAQRHVDLLRQRRRIAPLPEDGHAPEVPAAPAAPAGERSRCLELLRRAIPDALAALEPRERLRLACYYARDLTLAQIGRLLGEHEATVSRHLARTRRGVRAHIEQQLGRAGLSPDDVRACVRSAAADSGSLDVAELFAGPRKESEPDRSTGGSV